MSKVMLVDGHSLAYRAFFALPEDMATASGQVTNAVYGFTTMLLHLLRDHRPDQVVVAFDRPEPTFRHERLPSYKATREKTPETLRQQMGLVRELVEVLRIPISDHAGFEADDVIATLATQARDRGDDVMVVTGDRDSYQLVEDPHIKVLYNRRGVSEYTIYDEAQIRERTGVAPSDYVAYAALRGDPSDNLPGVDGVGEKTAAKLINRYGGIDGLFANLDDQTPKLRENLAGAEDRVRMNLELMVLQRDVPLEAEVGDLRLGDPDPVEVAKLLELLEFRRFDGLLADTLGLDLGGGSDTPGESITELDVEVVSPSGDEAASALAGLTGRAEPVSIAPAWDDASGKTHRHQLLGLALVDDAAAGRVVWLSAEAMDEPQVRDALGRFFGGESRFVAHDAKPIIFELLAYTDGLGLVFDTQIAAYLLDLSDIGSSGDDRYPVKRLLEQHTTMRFPEVGQPPEGQLDLSEIKTPPSELAALNALAVAHLHGPLGDVLAEAGMAELHDEMEIPLVRVLARMERVGIEVDEARLTGLRDKLASDAGKLRGVVIEAAGAEINVNSPKQISALLFDTLGLTPQKKTKSGAFSTDAGTLEKLRAEHSVVGALLDYREVEKLRSTYGEGLLAAVRLETDNRIRATFKQTVARTGRLSSDAPNLHNIPVRTEAGREFRQVFRSREGCLLLVADYNQIELRCIAHLAEDPGLIGAFESGRDVHTAVAAQVFGIDPAEVGIEERSTAKMVSYGLAYGMEAYGLGQRLNIPTGEAAVILDAFFEGFPAVRDYMDKTVAEARAKGYTETLFGRRRQISELNARNPQVRQAAERQAMNAGIQGLAADIFKVALVRLDAELEARALDSRIILQVHDEVILEVPEAELDEVAGLTEATMAGACTLRVPLEVHLSSGRTWADAK